MNANSEKSLPDWLPFVAGGLLVLQFAGLCAWQVSRGFEKLAQRDAFAAGASYSNYFDGADVRPYQPLKASGSFDGGRQVLLDNIILNSRHGYYVLTPLEMDEEQPVLLVNRGWLEKPAPNAPASAVHEQLAIGDAYVTVRGKAGSLPRAGMRMGDAILPGQDWPMTAVYPDYEDIERALGRAVQPFVLLLDPDEAGGFVRHWVPEEMGPGKHFGYALQWFAMGAVLAGLLAWHYRKRKNRDD